MDVFKLVVLTLPRYVDAPSREAVGHLAEALVRRDELRGKEDGESEASKMGELAACWEGDEGSDSF